VVNCGAQVSSGCARGGGRWHRCRGGLPRPRWNSGCGESHFNHGTLAYSARTGAQLWARFYGGRRATDAAISVAVTPPGPYSSPGPATAITPPSPTTADLADQAASSGLHGSRGRRPSPCTSARLARCPGRCSSAPRFPFDDRLAARCEPVQPVIELSVAVPHRAGTHPSRRPPPSGQPSGSVERDPGGLHRDPAERVLVRGVGQREGAQSRCRPRPPPCEAELCQGTGSYPVVHTAAITGMPSTAYFGHGNFDTPGTGRHNERRMRSQAIHERAPKELRAHASFDHGHVVAEGEKCLHPGGRQDRLLVAGCWQRALLHGWPRRWWSTSRAEPTCRWPTLPFGVGGSATAAGNALAERSQVQIGARVETHLTCDRSAYLTRGARSSASASSSHRRAHWRTNLATR